LITVAGLAVIFWLWSVLEAKRRAGVVRWANDTVARHTQAAEQHLAKREWDQALAHLDEALATPKATDLAAAQALLIRARQGQIEAVLESALAAIGQRNLDKARSLLEDYLAHPLAAQRQQARLWREALTRATSDEMAQALLRKLPEAALARFTEDGLEAEVNRLPQEPLQPVYRTTLARNLVREKERREIEELETRARREAERRAKDEEERRRLEKKILEEQRARKEREGRLVRIRATPVYRELTEYLALVRKQHRAFRSTTPEEDRRLLAALLAGPGKLNAQEQALLLADLKQRLAAPKSRADFGQWRDGVETAVSARRAQFKERFHAYPEFTKADWGLFDPLIDRELDQLLVEVRQPFEDDLALGLGELLKK
jgi:hypothetical protein